MEHAVVVRGVDWGPAVVQRLIAQRPPFLFVDRITGLSLEPRPVLRAARHIPANDPLLAGHFPKAPIWPGALTLEGMTQAAGCLATIESLAQGVGLNAVIAALTNAERGARLAAGFDADVDAELTGRLGAGRGPQLTLAGGARIRWKEPVFPGCRLDYEVTIDKRVVGGLHFSIVAEVDARVVAEGTVTATRLTVGGD